MSHIGLACCSWGLVSGEGVGRERILKRERLNIKFPFPNLLPAPGGVANVWSTVQYTAKLMRFVYSADRVVPPFFNAGTAQWPGARGGWSDDVGVEGVGEGP